MDAALRDGGEAVFYPDVVIALLVFVHGVVSGVGTSAAFVDHVPGIAQIDSNPDIRITVTARTYDAVELRLRRSGRALLAGGTAGGEASAISAGSVASGCAAVD